MNSKSAIKKAGVKTSHRKSLTRNMLSDLVIYEYLTTTSAKSKVIIPQFSKLITFIKTGKSDQEKERLLMKTVKSESAVKKLLEVFQKRFADVKGGYVSVYKLGNRKGDNAPLVKLMLKGYVYKDIGKKVTTKKADKKVEVKEDDKKGDFRDIGKIKGSAGKSQTEGGAAAQKVKTRSGI